jgi:NADH-quinone oxidoreductase subunit L
LAGIVPLAGFWSKDEILAGLYHDSQAGGGGLAMFVLVLALAGAFITAFYMARAVHLTFFGKYKGAGHPHESPRVMTYPLIGLAALAAVGGLVNIPGAFTPFTEWLQARAHLIVEHHGGFNWALAAIGTLVALAGIAAGTALFGRDRATQKERDRFRVPGLYPLLEHKYYMDDLYDYGLVRPIRGPLARAANWSNNVILDGVLNGAAVVARRLSALVYGGLDQRFIDLGFNAAAAATGETGQALRRAQTGKVQQYAAALFLGAVALAVGFLIFG